jgi:hypothetical protein
MYLMTQYLKKIGYDFTHIRQFYSQKEQLQVYTFAVSSEGRCWLCDIMPSGMGWEVRHLDRNGIRTVVKMPPFGTSSFWSNLEGIIVLSKKALNI